MIRTLMLATAALLAVPAAAAPAAPVAAASATPLRQMDHISVEAIGRGAPVILIPGLSMSRENWRATADRLTALGVPRNHAHYAGRGGESYDRTRTDVTSFTRTEVYRLLGLAEAALVGAS